MEWLGIVLGAGGVAFLTALFQGYKMIRDGTRAREREAQANMERWRNEADERARAAMAEADYLRRRDAWYQSRLGMRDYVILAHGLPVPDDPPEPIPPSELTKATP